MTQATGGNAAGGFTWRSCADAGMTLTEAAAAMGRTISAGSVYAKRNGFTFRRDAAANAERMRRLHADPEFAAANAERSAERMRRLHADPEFAAANAERSAERMRRLNADPEFAAAKAERMRRLHADPEFAAAKAERMRRLNADPEFNPLAALTASEREDYDILVKKGGMSRPEALAAINRADLMDRGPK